MTLCQLCKLCKFWSIGGVSTSLFNHPIHRNGETDSQNLRHVFDQKTKLMFGLLISKPTLKWSFASYSLIFIRSFLPGLNTLNTPPKWGTNNWTNIEGVYVGSWGLYENSSKIPRSSIQETFETRLRMSRAKIT